MTAILTGFVAAVIPSLFCGIVLQRLNKKSDERYEEEKERAKEREEGVQIQMRLVAAAGALSYATAVSLKRGKTNGELESAAAEYALARKDFNDFLIQTAARENLK